MKTRCALRESPGDEPEMQRKQGVEHADSTCSGLPIHAKGKDLASAEGVSSKRG